MAAQAEFVLDPRYEFSAPQYHDFVAGESRMDIEEAEHWFEVTAGYAHHYDAGKPGFFEEENEENTENVENEDPEEVKTGRVSKCIAASSKGSPLKEISMNIVDSATPATLPVKRPHSDACKANQALTAPKNSSMRNLTRYARDTVMKKMKKSMDKFMFRDDQTKKKAKTEDGSVNEVKEAKTPALTIPTEFQHWTEKRALFRGKENCTSTLKGSKLSSPFISLAEKVLKFQAKTPERFRSHSIQQDASTASLPQQRTALKLTVPKEPELETSHRARPPRVKSTAELEEEMLAKIPKFKARPVNKKILEAPSIPAVPKSNPQVPEFQEFHLRTMERALQHLCSSTMSSSDASVADSKQRRESAPGGLTEPHEPQLHTAARARPLKVKSREELEVEELARMPKFKARPLNKKIFESRGDLGIFRSHKRQLTVPVEFHFATEERCQQHHSGDENVSVKLEKEAQCALGPTVPRPFHLVTEHRGQVSKQKFFQELLEREQEERNMRVPKANPLPFTTDIPAIPPKPQPKECTKPEPFELESVARHEEELQRKAEELARMEYEEAEKRRFHAQPLPSFDSVFLPERSQMPPTEVEEFSFHVDARAAERAEFDRKVAEKQNQYRQLREELEAAKKAEEERTIKELRKAMIPQARPMPIFSKPFVPHRSTRGPTKAVSPRLRVLARKERRRSTEQRQSLERGRSLDQRRASSMLSTKTTTQVR